MTPPYSTVAFAITSFKGRPILGDFLFSKNYVDFEYYFNIIIYVSYIYEQRSLKMMNVKVLTVTEKLMKDKYNNNEEFIMYKITTLLPDGIVEIWTREKVEVGQELTLGIKAGKDYKPVVRIV